jgi:hypothetical protein
LALAQVCVIGSADDVFGRLRVGHVRGRDVREADDAIAVDNYRGVGGVLNDIKKPLLW